MIIKRFLLWSQSASAGRRAEAVGALARAYLYGDLAPDQAWEAETALTALLDDASALVRRALAEAVAGAEAAPRHLIVALAHDQGDVARLVLERSPVLGDPDLVDAAALGDDAARSAVANRPWLSTSVSAALAEIAGPEALEALARNPGAEIAPASLARMIERHGDDAPLREALLARPDLSLAGRQMLTARLAESLCAFVVECGWLAPERGRRATRESRERATLAMTEAAEREDVAGLVAHLRRAGQLTPALVLRALLSRRIGFVEAALAELTGLPAPRVAALLHDGHGPARLALLRRAGLPAEVQPALAAALEAWRESERGAIAAAGAQLSRVMIERALSASEAMPADLARPVLALLTRFDAEAARDAAREVARALAEEAALAAVLDSVPGALLESYRRGDRGAREVVLDEAVAA